MKKQRKKIKESFFNPVFQLFPIILFLIIDGFWGLNTAWKISFPVALLMILYVYFFYYRIFRWHSLFTLLFVSICLITGSESLFELPLVLKELSFEMVTSLFLFISLLFRKQIHYFISGYISKLIPMTNNLDEMYRFLWKLFIILLFFISGQLILSYSQPEGVDRYLQMNQYVFLGMLVFLFVYENLRVRIIRSKLLKEEWWPIVSEQGKIVGSIQHLTSLADENKYIHPVIRVMIIDKGMVLLQKRVGNSIINPGMWDTSISNHVRIGEHIEHCVDRTAKERFDLEGLKYLHLSNYTIELSNEFQYAFLFVSCQLVELAPNLKLMDQAKWWTRQQIEANMDSGIFSESFKIEYNLLLRSGLLDTGKCECSCRLKDAVYK